MDDMRLEITPSRTETIVSALNRSIQVSGKGPDQKTALVDLHINLEKTLGKLYTYAVHVDKKKVCLFPRPR
jgi:S1-C subfamily serine protease